MAHTPYVLPNTFSTSSAKKVTALATFTEVFFVPEFKMKSDDYHVLSPDGSRVDFDRHEMFSHLNVLEAEIAAEGTYRLTTGERLGRKFKMKKVDAGWDYIRRMGGEEEGEPEKLPEGTVTAEFQSQTVAYAYVSKGAPSQAALASTGRGLEIEPITHPSEIYFEEGFDFRLLFNGQPLAGKELEIARQGGEYEEPKFSLKVTTAADGRVSLRFDRPGIYGVMTRHQGEAPAGSETPYRSYTVALSFEVQR